MKRTLRRGECVIVIEGKSRQEIREEEKAQWEQLTVEEHMEHYLSGGMEKKRSHEAGGKRSWCE